MLYSKPCDVILNNIIKRFGCTNFENLVSFYTTFLQILEFVAVDLITTNDKFQPICLKSRKMHDLLSQKIKQK